MKKRNSLVILCSAAFAMSLALSGCDLSVKKDTSLSPSTSSSTSEGSEPASQKWTVTFDSQGGSAVSPISVENGQKITKPADPTKSDYNFDGWFEESQAVTPFDFTRAITANWTLYAGWVKKSAEPDPDPDPDPQPVTEADYFFKLNETYYGLTENKTYEGPALKEYSAHVGAVSGGEDFIFTNDQKVRITNVGSDPEDSSNKNNYVDGSEAGSFKIRNAASTIDVYFKVYTDGFSFWVTGYDNSQMDESPYHVMIGSEKVDLEITGTDSTDGDNIIGKYKGSATLVAGAAIEFHKEDGVIRPGAEAGDAENHNNVDGTWDDGYTVHNAAESEDIYLKEYDDGGYSFWITGYDDGTPVVTHKYYVEIGSGKYEMQLNSEATLLEGQVAEYTVNIAVVEKDQEVVFYEDTTPFTSDIGPDVGKNNGVKKAGQDFEFVIHNDAEDVNVYFKIWQGGYSFWITGYEQPAGAITYTCTSMPTWIKNDGCVVYVWVWSPNNTGSWLPTTYTSDTELTFDVEEELTGFTLARCHKDTTEPDWGKHDGDNTAGRVYNQTDDITCSTGVYTYTCSAWKDYK